MPKDHFFKDARLPFVECRYTEESDQYFKPHLHHAFCVGTVKSGSIVFQIDGQEAVLQPGTLALINPETIHSCNPEDSQKRSYYMLYLEKEWCLKIQQSLWQKSEFIPVDTIVLKSTLAYELFVETMQWIMGDAHLIEKEQHLVSLAEAIFARCCYPEVPVLSKSQDVADLKTWLGADLENDNTLEYYAAQKNINPYTLLRNFKRKYGVTPHAYRMNCRIEMARKLLQQGNDIADVALLSGFFDQSHFHRHFKAMTSVTPRQYQRSVHSPARQ